VFKGLQGGLIGGIVCLKSRIQTRRRKDFTLWGFLAIVVVVVLITIVSSGVLNFIVIAKYSQ